MLRHVLDLSGWRRYCQWAAPDGCGSQFARPVPGAVQNQEDNTSEAHDAMPLDCLASGTRGVVAIFMSNTVGITNKLLQVSRNISPFVYGNMSWRLLEVPPFILKRLNFSCVLTELSVICRCVRGMLGKKRDPIGFYNCPAFALNCTFFCLNRYQANSR